MQFPMSEVRNQLQADTPLVSFLEDVPDPWLRVGLECSGEERSQSEAQAVAGNWG